MSHFGLPRSIRVRVPGSSANLGPGFDSLGLSLAIYDEVAVRTTADTLHVEVSGEGSDRVPRDEAHLMARAMRAAFAAMRAPVPGLALDCENRIPHGRGLGSSAAAIVAGVLAARALTDSGVERLPIQEVLRLVSHLEGHPDNVAACLFGGLTIAWSGPAGPRAVRVEPHADIVPVVAVPTIEVSTKAARALLPTVVPHAAAAANAGRAALLVTALTGRPDLLFDATEDRVHQDYREPAMPETLALVHALRSRGIAAAVSGAGPSVIVLAVPADVDAATKVMASELSPGWSIRRLDIDRAGATVRRID